MTKLYTIRLLSIALITFTTNGLQAKDANIIPETGRLAFMENKGQVTDQNHRPRTDIDFRMATATGMNIFVGDGQLHYQWNKPDNTAKTSSGEYKVESYRMDVVLVGANRDATAVTDEQQAGYDHFYQPNTGKDGAKAYSYNRVTYRNIYPNIDWVLYSNNNELKYDFVVHPGGNASSIKLQYNGATSLEGKNGNVTIGTPFGKITEGKPYTYNAETKQEIASKFILNNNTLSFDVNTGGNAVVIDPAVNWVTYYGGSAVSALEFGKGVKADASGNVYMGGLTSSTDNVATVGAYQTVYGGSGDGFLVKFNAAGVRQWGTFYGGTGSDYFTSVDIDPSGAIYAAGVATSTTGIATPGTYLTAHAAGTNLMLVKFDNAGNRLWGTYCDGYEISGWTAFESSAQICCDPYGNVFMNHNSAGVKLTKFNSSGARFWGTAWQNGNFLNTGIASDASGNIYVVAGGWAAGDYNAYWAKFDNTGVIQFNTNFGGPEWDYPCGIAVDAAGDVYVSGETMSPTGIATAGTNRTTRSPLATPGSGNFDGFLMKFNSSGVKQWGAYVGNEPRGFRWSVAAGLNNKLYLAGVSFYSGASTWLNVLNSNSGMETSSVTINGNHGQENYIGITYSPAGKVYICGRTESTTGLATPGAHQTTLLGDYDPYLASFTVDTLVTIHQPFNDTVFCPGSTFKLPYDVSSNFNAGNIFTVYLSDASGSFASPVSIGTITSSVADTIVCTIPMASTPGNGYRIRISASNPVWVSDDNGINIRIDNTITPAILTYTATPGANVGPWVPVTFSVTSSGAGSTPTYQWKKNGTDISGATANTYTGVTGVDFITGDAITVAVTSSLACASPATILSSATVINVNTGVADVKLTDWQVFPNPTSGKIVLTGSADGEVAIQVMNIAGQVVYETEAASTHGKLRKEIVLDNKLANGVYLLRVASGDGVQTVRFSIEK